MRKLMLAGGWAGFGLGTVSGLLTEGSSWPGILFRASIAALGGGLLLRWWAWVLARCVAEAHAERQAAAAQNRASTPAGPTIK
jgi:hypothetical protein